MGSFSPLRLRRLTAIKRLRQAQTRQDAGRVLLWELAAEAHRRLASPRGRPTDPRWNLRRRIPLQSQHWEQLTRYSQEIGIAPAQLAALILEQGLARLAAESDLQHQSRTGGTRQT